MDAPRIQYTTSGDGTQIAYAVLGSGPPLLFLCPRFSGGLDIRLRARRSAPFYEALTANHRVTLFDWRNSGLSGPATSFTVESVVDDLESVVRAAGLQRFDLWAHGNYNGIAVEYAALHPEKLRRLVLARGPAAASSETYAFGISQIELALSDWNAFTELYALRVVGWFETGREWLDQFRKQRTAESSLPSLLLSPPGTHFVAPAQSRPKLSSLPATASPLPDSGLPKG